MASTFKEKLAGWGNYPVIESFTLSPRNEEDVRNDINIGPIVPRDWAEVMATRPLTMENM